MGIGPNPQSPIPNIVAKYNKLKYLKFYNYFNNNIQILLWNLNK